MLKLNASYSKKVPTEQKFSSESFLACVEVELPTGASAEELKKEIHNTFELVRSAVEAELGGRPASAASSVPQARGRADAPEGPASLKQIRYILDLGKAKERPLSDLNEEVRQLYGVDSIYELNKPDASRFLDRLKAA